MTLCFSQPKWVKPLYFSSPFCVFDLISGSHRWWPLPQLVQIGHSEPPPLGSQSCLHFLERLRSACFGNLWERLRCLVFFVLVPFRGRELRQITVTFDPYQQMPDFLEDGSTSADSRCALEIVCISLSHASSIQGVPWSMKMHFANWLCDKMWQVWS